MLPAGASALPAPPSWASPQSILRHAPFGSALTLEQVSCPSASLCVAVNDNGDAYTSTDAGSGAGATWSRTNLENDPLISVSCAQGSGGTLCAIADQDSGNVWTSTDPSSGTWAKSTIDGANHNLTDVSCTLAGGVLCMAVDSSGDAAAFTGASPSSAAWGSLYQAESTGAFFQTISCPSTSLCVGAEKQGDGQLATTTDPTDGSSATWSAPYQVGLPATPGLSLSCGQTSGGPVCAFSHPGLATLSQVWVSTDPGSGASSWASVATDLDPLGAINSVACAPDGSFCAATDDAGNAYVSDGNPSSQSVWTEETGVLAGNAPGFNQLSCPSASLCVGSDHGQGGVVTTTTPSSTTAWTSALISGFSNLAGVSCASQQLCVALGSNVHSAPGQSQQNDVLVSADPTSGPGSWSDIPVAPISDGALNAVTCSPQTTPSAAMTSGQTYSVCVVAGSNGHLWIDVPTGGGTTPTTHAWSSVSPTGAGSFTGISCPSTTLCVAVDGAGTVWTSTDPTDGSGSSWSPQIGVDTAGSPTAVSCSSATLCVITDSAGDVVSSTTPTSLGSWSAPVAVDTNADPAISAVSCTEAGGTLCAAAGASGTVISSVTPAGGSASDWKVASLGSAYASDGLVSVSCPTAALCVAGDSGQGTEFSSTNPNGGTAADWTPTQVEPVQPSGLGAYPALNGVACATTQSPTTCVAVDSIGQAITGQATDGDGAGAMSLTSVTGNGHTTTDPFVSSGATGQALTFTYAPPAGGTTDGTVQVTVPAGWPAPSGDSVTATGGWGADEVQTSGQVITVSGVTLTGSLVPNASAPAVDHLTITYTPSAAVPSPASPPRADTFTTAEASSASGTLVGLGSSPSVTIVAPDGGGTMTGGGSFSASSAGSNLAFTYTAPAGGVHQGTVELAVPSGWTTPQSTHSGGAGYVTSSAGSVTIPSASRTIEVSGLSLAGGSTVQIQYGDATAPSAPGSDAFTASEVSTPTGLVSSLSSSPSVQVMAADGSGTMSVSPISATQGTNQSLTFTYTAASGGTNQGTVEVVVPSGWTAPQSSDSGAPGYVSSDVGTVSVAAGTIEVSGLTLTGGSTVQIHYDGVTVPSAPGSSVFTASEASTSTGTVTAIASSPSVQVTLADGLGTMSVSPSNAPQGSSQSLTFTYTAAGGGMDHGTVEVAVPSGWTTPQTSDSGGPGYVSAGSGSVSILPGGGGTAGTIKVSGLTLAGGSTVQIQYGDATAPGATGTETFTTSEASTLTGAVSPILSSPSIQVLAADGSGTMTVSPSSVPQDTSQSLTFTYTAASGGTNQGTVELAVPNGWTSPQSSNSGGPGFVSTSAGTLTILPGNTVTAGSIEVSGLTLTGGSQIQIHYGDVTTPATVAPYTFTTSEASVAAPDSPVAITGAQPVVTVSVKAPGAPTLSSATAGNGQVSLAWSPPGSTGGASIRDYKIAEYAGTAATGVPKLIDTGSNATGHTVTGLTNGRAYTFTVQALNSAGGGGFSKPMTAVPATAPGAPAGVGTASGSGVVSVGWAAPTSDGGAPVSAYDVFRSTKAGVQGARIATVGSGKSVLDTTVTNGTTYYYEVTAVNRVGQGPPSPQISAMPNVPLVDWVVTVKRHKIRFSAPGLCVVAGLLHGKVTESTPAAARTKVKISKVKFTVGTLATTTIKRRRPSTKPVKVVLHVNNMVSGHSYAFSAKVHLVVGGRPQTQRLRLTVKAC